MSCKGKATEGLLCCMQVSSVEQEVCCSTGNLMGHYEAVRDLINSPHITDDDRWEFQKMLVSAQSQYVGGQLRRSQAVRCAGMVQLRCQ